MGGSFSTSQIPDCTDVTAIITGANRGMGKAIALELAKKGASVILACRSKKKATLTIQEIKLASNNNNIQFLELDLASINSVQRFANKIHELRIPINLLINNAGVMLCPFEKTTDGIESHFGVNYLGHFLLTLLLLDILEKNPPSRIVNVSSVGHEYHYAPQPIRFDKINSEEDYNPLYSYGQSKLCLILFTKLLATREKSKRLWINSVNPGWMKTDNKLDTLAGPLASYLISSASLVLAKSPEGGALTTLYAATSYDIENRNLRGHYFVPTGQVGNPAPAAQDLALAKELWRFSIGLLEELGVEDLERFKEFIAEKKIEMVESEEEEEVEETLQDSRQKNNTDLSIKEDNRTAEKI